MFLSAIAQGSNVSFNSKTLTAMTDEKNLRKLSEEQLRQSLQSFVLRDKKVEIDGLAKGEYIL